MREKPIERNNEASRKKKSKKTKSTQPKENEQVSFAIFFFVSFYVCPCVCVSVYNRNNFRWTIKTSNLLPSESSKSKCTLCGRCARERALMCSVRLFGPMSFFFHWIFILFRIFVGFMCVSLAIPQYERHTHTKINCRGKRPTGRK